jgi:hypothetical protein
MGNYIDRLEKIKARFLDSRPSDVDLFFKFLQEQFNKASAKDSRLIHLYPLSHSLIKRMLRDVSSVSNPDLMMAIDFTEQALLINRSEDSIDTLGIYEFYNREEIYTKLELFIQTLKRT